MIFIVDDDEAIRASLRLLPECEGLEVREFASCQEFLDADRGGIDGCLILDIRMPGENGLELLEIMHRDGSTLPVIIVSGRLDAETSVRARAFGVRALVEKPYGAGQILSPVRAALDPTLVRAGDAC